MELCIFCTSTVDEDRLDDINEAHEELSKIGKVIIAESKAGVWTKYSLLGQAPLGKVGLISDTLWRFEYAILNAQDLTSCVIKVDKSIDREWED